jgi:hypothetical protein
MITQVINQRRRYKRLHRTIDPVITGKELGDQPDNQRTAEQLQRLQNLGFVWDCSVIREELWNQRLEELKKFKERHGVSGVGKSIVCHCIRIVSCRSVFVLNFSFNCLGKITTSSI